MTREQDRRKRTWTQVSLALLPAVLSVVGILFLWLISHRVDGAVLTVNQQGLLKLPDKVTAVEVQVGKNQSAIESHGEMLREIRADIKTLLREQK